MGEIHYIILLPVLCGLILMVFPDRIKIIKGIIASVVAAFTLALSIVLFIQSTGKVCYGFEWKNLPYCESFSKVTTFVNDLTVLNADNLSRMVVVLICFFAFIILIYSLGYINVRQKIYNYYPYFLITLGCAAGAVFADNLLFFIFCWGILGITLYKLIKGYDDESASIAKKTLVIIGASDCFMILGIAIIWKISKSFNISTLDIQTHSVLSVVAFISLLIGSFTKAGAFPFHTWIPDFTTKAPATSSAYLPASLDKLLGIYFMYRLCVDIFILNKWLTLTIVILGVTTIIVAVMMALVQQNTKRLLGYHAVSQVGYMVLGLGLGNPIGIAGGLFHMINHTLYKSGLFLVSGNVEMKTGTDNIDQIGGLARVMPLTFISALVFALSISGVPPFNGFASKWLIYQGIIDFGKGIGPANQLWMVWLVLAVIGSALTLASFLKLLSGIFLGRKTEFFFDLTEVRWLMWLPVVILAVLCTGIGIFASNYFIPHFIKPLHSGFAYTGIWNSTAVALLVLVSIIIGVILYLIGNIKNFRSDDNFIGGEKDQEIRMVSVLEFYKTISNNNFFSWFYKKTEKKWFDLYDIIKNIVFGFYNILSKCHTGVLSLYAIWLVAGLIILLILLL